MIRAPDEYKRECLAGPQVFENVDPEMQRILEESRKLHERRQQRMAEFAPLLSKLKRIGFYDTVVQKQYQNIILWCESYYEGRTCQIDVSFKALVLIRWTLSERAALDKVKISVMNNPIG